MQRTGEVFDGAGAGGQEIEAVGATVSTLKLRSAGVGSVLAAGSVARTAKVWLPSGSEARVFGDEQAANEPPSTLHSNVEPASFEEKLKVGVGLLVGPEGPESIVVSGGVVSVLIGLG